MLQYTQGYTESCCNIHQAYTESSPRGRWRRSASPARAASTSPTVRAASGRLSALSVSLWKSSLYGAFVWARRAFSGRKWRFPARAEWWTVRAPRRAGFARRRSLHVASAMFRSANISLRSPFVCHAACHAAPRRAPAAAPRRCTRTARRPARPGATPTPARTPARAPRGLM